LIGLLAVFSATIAARLYFSFVALAFATAGINCPRRCNGYHSFFRALVSIGSDFSLGVIPMFSLMSCLFLLLFLGAAVYFVSQLRDDPRSAIIGLVVLLVFCYLIFSGGADYDYPAIPSNYCRFVN